MRKLEKNEKIKLFISIALVAIAFILFVSIANKGIKYKEPIYVKTPIAISIGKGKYELDGKIINVTNETIVIDFIKFSIRGEKENSATYTLENIKIESKGSYTIDGIYQVYSRGKPDLTANYYNRCTIDSCEIENQRFTPKTSLSAVTLKKSYATPIMTLIVGLFVGLPTVFSIFTNYKKTHSCGYIDQVDLALTNILMNWEKLEVARVIRNDCISLLKKSYAEQPEKFKDISEHTPSKQLALQMTAHFVFDKLYTGHYHLMGTLLPEGEAMVSLYTYCLDECKRLGFIDENIYNDAMSDFNKMLHSCIDL